MKKKHSIKGKHSIGKKRSMDKKLLPWARKKWGSLSFRLIYVVAATFLPLNILAILAAGLVMGNASRQLQDFYQRELDFSMERLEENLLQIDRHMSSTVLSYLTPLTLTEESDNMVSYDILWELREGFMASEQTGIYYLYDKRTEQMFVKYTSGAYSYWDIEKLRGITGEAVPEGVNEWRLCNLQGRWFLVKYFEYTNYRIGFLVDVPRMLDQAFEGDFLSENDFYLTDGYEAVQFSEEEFSFTAQEWRELGKDRLLYQSAEWGSAQLGIQVMLRIPRNIFLGSIPLLYWLLLVFSLLCVMMVFGLWRMLRKRVVGPILILREAMGELEQKNLGYRITQEDEDETDEFRYLYESFNHMAREVEASYEKDVKMVQSQLDTLRLQVNPHMLLNSFNMIYSLAQTKNYECIQEFSMYLVEYFRYALKETDTYVPLKKEMDFVESYTGIQKIRFPGAFTSVYHVQPEAWDAWIPPLLIQNFVENAMKYALIPGKTIEVLINIRKQEDRLLVSVCDTGSGIKEEVLQSILNGEIYTDKMGHKHIGVWNCRRRMEMFYGGAASLHITSKRGEGTQVWLELPFRADGNAGEKTGGVEGQEKRRESV